jgi:DNA-binding transcriptional regulator YiaG
LIASMSDDFPVDVAAIRQELGLSQAAFGEKVGVDQSTVSLWETGKSDPRGPARNWMLKLLQEHRESRAA